MLLLLLQKRNRYTPEHVTISDRKSQVLLEYNPSRVLYAWPNSIKERDIVYKELGLDFEFWLLTGKVNRG